MATWATASSLAHLRRKGIGPKVNAAQAADELKKTGAASWRLPEIASGDVLDRDSVRSQRRYSPL
jgi:hypothetical protein